MDGCTRCAIYTRKSTEEGLDQEFNSLDAQREACAAYILSQKHEGWTLVPTFYDDGGFSGGTMDRPGLKQLLADVAAGRVDVIVVYKVDRLTRALSDFAKIVEVLNGAGASFVSVTQAFNTTTSMGRLTLNVLLSFAQFEREVTGERIRDKVAASKRKGIWMGGVVPLGYDVRQRKLLINPAEAETVRLVFRRYVALQSVGQLAQELENGGIRSKLRVLDSGDALGGRIFSKGALAYLLQNRMYLGQIVHKGESFPGEHEAIVSADLFEQVQSIIAGNRVSKRLQARARHPNPLAGMLVDPEGRRMTPVHTNKGTRRYRYYVTAPDEAGRTPTNGWRVPAGDLETLIQRRVAEWLRDSTDLAAILQTTLSSGELPSFLGSCHQLGLELCSATPLALRQLLLDLETRIGLAHTGVSVVLRADRLLQRLNYQSLEPEVACTIAVDVALVRRGQELRLALPPSERTTHVRPDVKLLTLLAKAELAHQEILSTVPLSPARRPHLMRLARLKFLAPDITSAILEGRQPPALTARALLRAPTIPLQWPDQRELLGFA